MQTGRFLISLMLVVAMGCSVRYQPGWEKEAATAGRQWLGHIDRGLYTNAWNEAASQLRNARDAEDWVKMLHAFRRPLGDVVTRGESTKRYVRALPGLPDGDYFSIRYKTVFQNKRSAVETLHLKRETNGIWRVSGYYVR